MCGKFGVRDIIVNNDGTCLFKFRDINGLNFMVEKGPWMVNDVLLEAWSVDGISALANSLGNPLIMDTTTTTMCHNGMGRLDYVRVLVEMDVDKEFKKVIEVQYRDSENKVKGTKRVNVSYDWKPNACTYCMVFRHEFKGCTIRPRTPEEEEAIKRKEEELNNPKNDNMDNFRVQDKWKNTNFMQYSYKGNGKLKEVRAEKNNKGVFGNSFGYKRQEYIRKQTDSKGKESDVNSGKNEGNKKQWPLKHNEFEAMKKTANKFTILQILPDDNPMELNTLKDKMIVDQFLNNKIQPSVMEISNWSNDMVKYFKERWEEDRKRDADNDVQKDGSMESDEEDIVAEVNGMKENVITNEITGRDMYMHKRASGTLPWAIMGDMNVTLKLEEHSNGGSSIIEDMQDFIDCVNQLEVEDIGSSGFFYTWTKSLKNPNNSILKKLDRIMVSEHFLTEFEGRHAIFQPFLVSDHSPTVLVIPQSCPKKPNSFRFANYTADKPEFINEVTNGWKYKDEEKLLAQNARVDWLNEGDKNSSFFHKVIKGRRSRNRVATICDEDGNYYEGDKVPKQFVKHFQKFLGIPSNSSNIVMTDDLFCNVLTPEEAV
ncbi:RNA-directed DNA polymerase, eukaryota, reverse transcriptase zinc-binding domain protein [Tanacetum coccineum]